MRNCAQGVGKCREDVNPCGLSLGSFWPFQDPGDAANLALECRLGTKMGERNVSTRERHGKPTKTLPPEDDVSRLL